MNIVLLTLNIFVISSTSSIFLVKCTGRDWNQNATDVTVHLFAGKKLSVNDLNVEFTDIGVNISLIGEFFCEVFVYKHENLHFIETLNI